MTVRAAGAEAAARRAVRRALARLGLEDVIEARQGFGYRLTVEPPLGE